MRESLKIVHVTQHLGVGGLEKIIFHLINEQRKMGHTVDLYVYDCDRSWIDYFKKNGINVITPPLKKNGYDLNLMINMNRDLIKYDIINSHDLNPLMYLAPLMLFRIFFLKKSPKLIHTSHGLAHLNHKLLYKFYEKLMSYPAHAIVCVSEKIKSFYLDELKVNPKKIFTIENGITIYEHEINQDLKNEKREELCKQFHLDFNRPIILSLARIVPLKNQLFIAKAIKERPGYQLIIVGPNNDNDYYEQLKNLSDKNIVLVPPNDRIDIYHLASDLYVSASLNEGLPIAVLEAISLENPVLISDIPSHLQLNTKQNLALIFQNNNSDDFLNKLDYLLKNRFSLNLFERRKYVEKNYSSISMTEKYLAIYRGNHVSN